MKRVVAVTPEDARHGFALTGVQQVLPAPGQVQARVRALLDDPGVGVVVLDERLAAGELPAQLREIERRWPGLVVVLPAPEVAARLEEDYVLRLIRRAIGYQVRLGS